MVTTLKKILIYKRLSWTIILDQIHILELQITSSVSFRNTSHIFQRPTPTSQPTGIHFKCPLILGKPPQFHYLHTICTSLSKEAKSPLAKPNVKLFVWDILKIGYSDFFLNVRFIWFIKAISFTYFCSDKKYRSFNKTCVSSAMI